ncbi:hypothetical protein HN51_068511 [Arachis hypogaea]|uniref:Uncharacterized protein n=1 Tax=Arachis hypogaea TaxID=3818 RepID=A0A444ZA25_ARAHY|nr:uncharacterized protein LOC107641675 [Arachis ipaensis]XP_025652784.1 uncharacterized protein LOC112748755 isoform X1 [Arachis hypogaea]RYR11031.1 hypothetical protein Ahy_B05g079523 [Arachis hypogaea]
MEARQGSNHERRWMVALMAVCLWVRERNLGMADEKDAEALRCHRQLVEEEEAAQKRSIQAREQKHATEIEEHIGSAEDDLSTAKTCLATYDFKAHNLKTFIDSTPLYNPFQWLTEQKTEAVGARLTGEDANEGAVAAIAMYYCCS